MQASFSLPRFEIHDLITMDPDLSQLNLKHFMN